MTRCRPLAIILLALLGACGGVDPAAQAQATARPAESTSTTPAPSTADGGSGSEASVVPPACDLLTDADLEELAGWSDPQAEPDPLDTIYANSCRWTRGDGAVGSIDLGIKAPGGRSYFDTLQGTNGVEPLEGVGDAGLTQDITGSVVAVTGDVLVDLFVVDPFGSGDPSIDLLKRALANLAGR